jgi:hypothetical protein
MRSYIAWWEFAPSFLRFSVARRRKARVFGATRVGTRRHAAVIDRGHSTLRSATEPLRVTIVAAIAAIWALGVLSLLFTLPHEVLSPADANGDAISGLSER